MTIRTFLKNLISGSHSRKPQQHEGHELAKQVRDAMGPQAGGNGRAHGGASLRYFESKNE